MCSVAGTFNILRLYVMGALGSCMKTAGSKGAARCVFFYQVYIELEIISMIRLWPRS